MKILIVRLGKWILAFAFGSVDGHTMWRQRSRTGFDYVRRLERGMELRDSINKPFWKEHIV
jgi:hypothetical protein